MTTDSWHDLWSEVSDRLGSRQEAQFLLEHVSGTKPARWGGDVSAEARSAVDALVARRRSGEPLQYVLGTWAFRSLELKVDARALIPRPETEELVEAVLPLIGEGTHVLDLGTGTGAIALSIKQERPSAIVTAIDVSAEALSLARENASGLGFDIDLREGSWFAALDATERFDVIVTNPPYVEADAELDDSVRQFEPHSALFAGADGLDDIRQIIAEAPVHLNEGGVVAIEMHPAQTEEASALARTAGFTEVRVIDDITSRPRILLAQL